MVVAKGINTVIFDFDGTLFDLAIDWQKLRQRLGVDESVKLGELFESYVHAADPKLDIVRATELEAVGGRHLERNVVKMLKKLRDQRYNLAIFTRNARKTVMAALRNTGLKDLYVVGHEDVQRLKPDPEGLRRILGHFKAGSNQAVVVGDTYHDLVAAHASGVRCILVKNEKLSYRPEGADYYINSLSDLPDLCKTLKS